MSKQKEHDWVLNLMQNQDLSVKDLNTLGLTADNTSLLSEDTYKASKQILDAFKNPDGTFDNTAFHKFYENAQSLYGVLSNKTLMDKQNELYTVYGKDNLFAPEGARKLTLAETVKFTRENNPDRRTTGMVRIGETEAPRWSMDEIALTLKSLKNPIEAAKDWSKAIWDDAPNDNFFGDFFDTKVMALWDEDGTHTDLVTGETVEHKKGEYKLNENGTYYYEDLEGRDIYGKQVLNKMNVLTTDGTWQNKYLDWLDSDDIEEAPGRAVVKNALLVGSMFLPYVGPVIAGLSVATLTVGLLGTLGKIATMDNNSPIFSEMEGWSKSLSRQTLRTQEARQHTWSLENWINLVGDVAGLLKEQRFLFEYAPALFKGTSTTAFTKAGREAKRTLFIENESQRLKKLYETKIEGIKDLMALEGKSLTIADAQSIAMAKNAIPNKASQVYNDFMKSYNHIGSVLSKGYMTAITTGDSYGEFKQAGLSDVEAGLMTLGYAASEAWLLNTGVGEWILPELKGERLQTRQMLSALLKDVPKEVKAASAKTAASKITSALFWIDKGKAFHKACKGLIDELSNTMKSVAGLAFSGGLGEGIEEVSEEALADAWRGIAGVSLWLQGKDLKAFTFDTEQWFDRYAMSFLGGAMGGSLTAIGTNFGVNGNPYTGEHASEKARLQMIYMLQNGKKDLLLKTLNSMEIADTNLSFDMNRLENGLEEFVPADENHLSKDAAIKQVFTQNINNLDSILKAEGLDVSLDKFLDISTLKDIRLGNLLQSVVSTAFILDFLNLTSEITKVKSEINSLKEGKSDSDKPSDLDLERISKLEQQLLNLRTEKDKYLNGDYAMDYISLSLMDLTPIFSQYITHSSFKDYAEHKSHRKFEDLSDKEVEDLRKKFVEEKNGAYRDKLNVIAPLFLQASRNSRDFIQEFTGNYDKIRRNQTLVDLLNYTQSNQNELNANVGSTEAENLQWLQLLSTALANNSVSMGSALIATKNKPLADTLKTLFITLEQTTQLLLTETDDALKLILKDKEASLKSSIFNTITDELSNHLDAYFSEFITTGSINPEIKKSLLELTGSLYNNILNLKLPDNLEEVIENVEVLGINLSDSTSVSDLEAIKDSLTLAGDKREVNSLIEILNKVKQYTEGTRAYKDNPTIGDFKWFGTNQDLLKTKILDVYNKIKNTNYTDVVSFIDDYMTKNTDSNINFMQLIDDVNNIISQEKNSLDLAEFGGKIEQIDEALEILNWCLALVLGAQVDPNSKLQNLVGYNVTLNLIAKENGKEWDPLPEITLQTAQIINLDISIIRNKLNYAKNIYYINLGSKINSLNRVASNKNYITYLALLKLIVNIDDSWGLSENAKKALSDLRDAINNVEILKKERDEFNKLSIEDRRKAELEMTTIDDAIYNLFQTNQDKINRGDLKDLFKSNYNFYNIKRTPLSENTGQLEDRDIFNYLATRAAIKRSSFNKVFGNVIDPETGIAPLPGQEEIIFLGVATILNGDMIERFRSALELATYDNFSSLDDDGKRNAILSFDSTTPNNVIDRIINDPKTLANTYLFPKFKNLFLVNGGPGTGKTTGVDYYINKVIAAVDKDLAEKSLVVHLTTDRAKSLAEALGAKNHKSISELMSYIYSGYNTGRKVVDGIRLYDASEVEEKDGIYKGKFTPDDHSVDSVPPIIYIDEISHLDEIDLLLLSDFASKYGITVIGSGDYKQSTAKAEVQNYFGEKKNLILSPVLSYLMGGPALDVSMRSRNAQIDKSMKAFEARAEFTDPFDFYYYEDANGLKGIKAVSSDEELEQSLKLLVDTAGDEKIGFVYNDDNSKVLDIIRNKYADKFTLLKGSAALGLEGKYFVVDKTNVEQEDFYTGITRSEQGTLVYHKDDYRIRNHKENTTSDTSVSLLGLKNFATLRKEFYLEIFNDAEDLKFIKRSFKNTTGSHKPAPTFRRTPAPSKLFDTVTHNVTLKDGTKISPIALLTDLGEKVIFVDLDGLKIPFVQVADKWIPALGFGTKANFGIDSDNYYQSEILKGIATFLDNNYDGNDAVSINDIQETIDFNSNLKGVDESDPYFDNIMQTNLKLIVDHFDEMLLKYLSFKAGDEFILKGTTMDGPAKVSNVLQTLDGFAYEFTNGTDTLVVDASEVESNPDTYLTKVPVNTWANPTEVIDITLGTDKYACDGVYVALYNSDGSVSLVTDPDIESLVLSIFNYLQDLAEIPESAYTELMKDNEPPKLDHYTYRMYSFNALNPGVLRGSDGKIVYPSSDMSRYRFRIDGMIGLAKVFEPKSWQSPKTSFDEYEDKLIRLRNLIMNSTNKNELLDRLSYIMRGNIEAAYVRGADTNKVVDIEFGLVSSPKKKGLEFGFDYAGTGDSMLDRSSKELVIGNDGYTDISRKAIYATITLANDLRVSIPLFTLGNFATLANYKNGSVESFIMNALFDKYKDDFHLFSLAVQNHPKLPKNIKNLAKLFDFTSAGYFKIKDKNWLPSTHLHNYGPLVTMDVDSHGRFTTSAQIFNVDLLVSVNHSLSMSSQIHISNAPLADGTWAAQNGKPFVMTYPKGWFKSDEEAWEYHLKYLNDNTIPKLVNIRYIVPPVYTIEEYLVNLNNILNKKGDVVRLGLHTTSYKIFDALLKDKTAWDSIKGKLSNEDVKWIENTITSLQGSSNLVADLMIDHTWNDNEGVKGRAKISSILEVLNLALILLTRGISGDLNLTLVTQVSRAIEHAGIGDVKLNPSYMNKKASTDKTFQTLQSDQNSGVSTYTTNGKAWTTRGKEDTNIFAIDDAFDGIILGWVDGITVDSKGVYHSADTEAYIKKGKTTKTFSKQFTLSTDIGDGFSIDVGIDDKGSAWLNGVETAMSGYRFEKAKLLTNKEASAIIDNYGIKNAQDIKEIKEALLEDYKNYKFNSDIHEIIKAKLPSIVLKLNKIGEFSFVDSSGKLKTYPKDTNLIISAIPDVMTKPLTGDYTVTTDSGIELHVSDSEVWYNTSSTTSGNNTSFDDTLVSETSAELLALDPKMGPAILKMVMSFSDDGNDIDWSIVKAKGKSNIIRALTAVDKKIPGSKIIKDLLDYMNDETCSIGIKVTL